MMSIARIDTSRMNVNTAGCHSELIATRWWTARGDGNALKAVKLCDHRKFIGLAEPRDHILPYHCHCSRHKL